MPFWKMLTKQVFYQEFMYQSNVNSGHKYTACFPWDLSRSLSSYRCPPKHMWGYQRWKYFLSPLMSKDQSSSDIDLVLCLKRWRIPKVSKGNTCLQMQKQQVLQWRRLVIASLTFVMLSLQILQPVGDYISGKGTIETSGAKHCTNKKNSVWSGPVEF